MKKCLVVEGAKPYHAKTFPIHDIHKKTLKSEVNRLLKIGEIERKNNSKWATPTFYNSKKEWDSSFHF